VVALVLVFQHSAKLADIYGVAVTGTFILNTTLFLAVARSLWHTPRWKLAGLGALFLTIEVAFFSSNLAKITHGGWLPLGVGLAISVVMITWRKGREIVAKNRAPQEQPLEEFLDSLRTRVPRIQRVPGTAVFLNPSKQTVPLALRAEVDHNHILHDKVVIVSLDTASLPRVESPDQFVVQWLGHGRFKVVHVTVRVGYQERQDVPAALALARKRGLLERNLDLEHASYFLSHTTIVQTDAPGMRPWRKRLFITMARNSASPIDHFGLPRERTVIIGSQDPI
jgi:KUP system potassium uptake protein